MAKYAIESKIDIIGISILAGGHKTLISQLIEQVEQKSKKDMIIVTGGVIPPCDYQFLKDIGVSSIFGPGTSVVDAANTRYIRGKILKKWRIL